MNIGRFTQGQRKAAGLALALIASLACSAVVAAPPPHAGACVIGAPGCKHQPHRLMYPVHALSFGNGGFSLHPRGVNWANNNGAMTLTLRRPLDYDGGDVTVTLFYQLTSDEIGDITFHITPVTMHHGSGFETYGAVASNTVVASGDPTMVLEQSAVIPPGNGFSPDGDWWYLEIGREGTYNLGLRMMSVAIDY